VVVLRLQAGVRGLPENDGLSRSAGAKAEAAAALAAAAVTFGWRGRVLHDPPFERGSAAQWYAEVKQRACERCGCRWPVFGHHVVPRSKLKQMNLREWLWCLANLMVLCQDCHRRHEEAVDRVPWWMLRPENIAFAEWLGLVWLLERRYPKEVARG
jgi:hypothetical protein